MALIRRSDAEVMARDAVVLDLGRLEAQGDALVSGARARAGQIIEDAQAERAKLIADAAEVGERKGFEAGHAEGLEAGRTEGRAEALAAATAEIDTLASRWAEALDAFEAGRNTLLGDAHEDLITLACEIARRATGRIVELHPESIVDQFAEILSVVVQPTTLRVRVSPEDEPFIAEAMPGLVARFADGSDIELVADGSLARGSCIAVTARHGAVDGSVSTKLDRLIDSILPRTDEAA